MRGEQLTRKWKIIQLLMKRRGGMRAQEIQQELSSPVRTRIAMGADKGSLAFALFALVCIWPQAAWATSMDGLELVVVAYLIGIPYGLALLVLSIIGLVFLAKDRPRPTYAGFLIIAPAITSSIYLLPFCFKSVDYLFAHLIFSSPAFLLSICAIVIGIFLRRKARRLLIEAELEKDKRQGVLDT